MTAWIGLTGGIGSGKSQVAACFSALNIPIIDADAISHQLTETPDSMALQRIVQTFGEQVIHVSGCLNRAYMRELVFGNPTAKRQLEAILHPLIQDEIRQQQNQIDALYGIVEIPILIENPAFQNLVSRILVVECRESIRLQRVMQRNSLSEAAVRAIMATQASDAERAARADDIIRNESSLNALNDSVYQLHQHYCLIFQAAFASICP